MSQISAHARHCAKLSNDSRSALSEDKLQPFITLPEVRADFHLRLEAKLNKHSLCLRIFQTEINNDSALASRHQLVCMSALNSFAQIDIFVLFGRRFTSASLSDQRPHLVPIERRPNNQRFPIPTLISRWNLNEPRRPGVSPLFCSSA